MISSRYVAGFFDGEGCIYVYRKMGVEKPYIHLRVTISQVNRLPLDLIKARYGGSVHRLYQSRGKHQTCYQWTAACRTAIRFLESISTHLIIKREKAIKAVYLARVISENKARHVKGVRGSYVSKEEWEYRGRLMEICNDENKKLADMHHSGVAELMYCHRLLSQMS